MLRQQLDALSRLVAIARRLVDAPAPAADTSSVGGISAALRGLERALRLQARVSFAIRLIHALRAKLVADLQAVESGQAPAPAVEARSFAANPETAASNEGRRPADPVERAERPERLERERFGFERRGSDARIAEILKRPTEEVIALICRELGLPDDWPRRAEEAWAREEAEREKVGAPADLHSTGGREPSPPGPISPAQHPRFPGEGRGPS